jgi:hypothetical protein
MQMVSLRRSGCTHAGPSPLSNKAVRGQPVTRIQAQQSKNYLPACVTIYIKAPCAGDGAFNHPFSLFPVKGPYQQVLLLLLLYDNIRYLFLYVLLAGFP